MNKSPFGKARDSCVFSQPGVLAMSRHGMDNGLTSGVILPSYLGQRSGICAACRPQGGVPCAKIKTAYHQKIHSIQSASHPTRQ